MKHLESIGLVDDITTGYAKGGVKEIWYGMYNQLLEFKQKHGHVKVPQRYNENPELGIWVMNRRRDYRAYKKINGQRRPWMDETTGKHWIGWWYSFRIHHDKMMNCANIKVSTPMIASSMSPTVSSYTQNITKEVPLFTLLSVEKKSNYIDKLDQHKNKVVNWNQIMIDHYSSSVKLMKQQISKSISIIDKYDEWILFEENKKAVKEVDRNIDTSVSLWHRSKSSKTVNQILNSMVNDEEEAEVLRGCISAQKQKIKKLKNQVGWSIAYKW
jgi:hypothetical protein